MSVETGVGMADAASAGLEPAGAGAGAGMGAIHSASSLFLLRIL